MRPTTGFIGRPAIAAEARLARLISIAASLNGPITPDQRRAISYVVIEAAALWAQYARCLYLSAAYGASDNTGKRVVAVPSLTEGDAIDRAVWAVHPKFVGTSRKWSRRDLPDFQSKSVLAKTLRSINASIANDVDIALGYPTRVLADLPTMRNFYAHKAEDAAAAAMRLAPRYGITRRLRTPHDLVWEVAPGRSDVLLREWLADLTAILGSMPH